MSQSEYQGVRIIHEWFAKDDYRQDIVQRAYEVWWMDLVVLIECENGNWNPFAVWDSWKAFGLCQMNSNYHKIPQEYFDDWGKQIEICAEKRKWWTKFYGPDRLIKWVRCSKFVLDRFIFIE